MWSIDITPLPFAPSSSSTSSSSSCCSLLRFHLASSICFHHFFLSERFSCRRRSKSQVVVFHWIPFSLSLSLSLSFLFDVFFCFIRSSGSFFFRCSADSAPAQHRSYWSFDQTYLMLFIFILIFLVFDSPWRRAGKRVAVTKKKFPQYMQACISSARYI